MSRGPFQSRKLRVALLGATGVVGQRIARRLLRHPWFELGAVAASGRSAGKRYREATTWQLPETLPEPLGEQVLEEPTHLIEAKRSEFALILSALDSATARELEPAFVQAGYAVITNASAFRMNPEVPLIIPEVNADHLELVSRRPDGHGFLVANPNCSTTGLILALAPLERSFGLTEVRVTTLQAASGAGFPGVPSLELLGNVLPGIPGEEEKLESEPRKIFGTLRDGSIRERCLPISADTHRVPVVDGHLLSVDCRLNRSVPLTEVYHCLKNFRPPAEVDQLPSAPAHTLIYIDHPHRPQPRMDSDSNNGMSVSIGRLRPSPLGGFRFTVLVPNTERGAAGGTLLLAELVAARGLLGASRQLACGSVPVNA